MKNLYLISLIVLTISTTLNAFSQCTSTVFYNSNFIYNDATIGSNAWQSPTNAQIADNQYATCHMVGNNLVSNYLFAIEYIIPVPSNATICGIELHVKRHANQLDSVTDNDVRLIKNLAIVGINKAANLPIWNTTDTEVVYGGDTALWGTTWTPNDIYNGSFGAAFSVREYDTTNSGASVDNMKIRIWYHLPTDIENIPAKAENTLSIFPNPAHNQLTISLSTPSTNQLITITDPLGNKIYQTTYSTQSTQSTIDITKWSKGIYFLQLTSEKESLVKKIIIN